MKEKYLPIGTVVLLKGATKRLMITGYCSLVDTNSTKIYDYIGSMFPEANLGGSDVALFDHDQIDVVSHMGLVDDEFKEFNTNLFNIVHDIDSSIEKQKPAAPVEEPAYNGMPNDLNKMIQSISIESVKEQMLTEPTEFDADKLKVPTFDMKAKKTEDKKEKEVSVTISSNETSAPVSVGDGKPVLQLEPIFHDSNDDDSSSTSDAGIFERL